MSNFANVLTTLTSERDQLQDEVQRLNEAIRIIKGLNGNNHHNGVLTGGKARRNISAAGRARIAAAQRARWAKVKRSQIHTPVRKMSLAARRKIAAAQRARWAKTKRAA